MVQSGNAIDFFESMKGVLYDQNRAIQVFDWEHWNIHAGLTYAVQYRDTLDNAGTADILLVTPDIPGNSWHTVATLQTTNGGEMEMFEDTLTSDDGTGLPVFNHNRTSEKTTSMLAYHTPTITDVGTQLPDGAVMPVSVGFFSGEIGSTASVRNEWILKPNSKYLFRFTSLAASNDIMWKLDWYDHDHEGVIPG